MKLLAQHPDFRILLQNAGESLKIRPTLVLKDYWVTAVLRVLAASDFRGKFLFKGGTSLSKGWKLIDRFSEDVDLLLTGKDFSGPPDRKSEREKQMKAIRDYVSAKLPLEIPDQKDRFFYYRDDWHMEARYVWDQPQAKHPPVDETVLLEVGFRGGANPHNTRHAKFHGRRLHLWSTDVGTKRTYRNIALILIPSIWSFSVPLELFLRNSSTFTGVWAQIFQN